MFLNFCTLLLNVHLLALNVCLCRAGIDANKGTTTHHLKAGQHGEYSITSRIAKCALPQGEGGEYLEGLVVSPSSWTPLLSRQPDAEILDWQIEIMSVFQRGAIGAVPNLKAILKPLCCACVTSALPRTAYLYSLFTSRHYTEISIKCQERRLGDELLYQVSQGFRSGFGCAYQHRTPDRRNHSTVSVSPYLRIDNSRARSEACRANRQAFLFSGCPEIPCHPCWDEGEIVLEGLVVPPSGRTAAPQTPRGRGDRRLPL